MRTTLTIKKRSQPGWLMWLIIVLPFLFGLLNDLLGLPWMIRYLLDAAWLALILFMVRLHRTINMKAIKGLAGWVCIFLLYTCVVYLVQYQSAFYYLWGFRNNFRFYMVFLAFAAFLTPREIDDYIKTFDKLFMVNAIVSLIQYYGFEIKGDYLGGIFGAEQGCNGYTTIFNSIIVIKTVVFYLENKESVWLCLAKCAAALYIAVLAEMKFFFVAFVVITALALLFTDFTWRKILLILGGSVGVALGTALLAQLFSGDENWFSLDWILNVATSDKGYTSSGDLNRLNAIPQINELWLRSWGQRLFGLGLGNCETSAFAAVNTPFYKANSASHYTWLSYAFMYLECGWVGLIFYFGFFILAYFRIRRIEKRSSGEAVTYCRLGRIMALMCMLISVYNSSLRTEAGYMAYFVLAVPFAYNKNVSQNAHQ